MAIYSSVPPPSQQAAPSQATAAIDIDSWTVSALQSLSVSPSAVGTGVTLSIPLDTSDRINDALDSRPKVTYKTRKEPLRRDSMKRRDALLRGKEGSRRRQRWENDHLINVPNAQPPLPQDWQPMPTYKIHHVPYYLAPLWDAGIRHRAEEIQAEKAHATASRAGIAKDGKGRVPAELRQKLKKSKGAKTLLQELEEEVRTFVREFERKERERAEKTEDELDSEDDEIVFVGRGKDGRGITMSDEVKEVLETELQREKLVYECLAGSKEGGFARWLVHCVADYYGLSSRSVTKGVKREAYVGIRGEGEKIELPRPLWGLV